MIKADRSMSNLICEYVADALEYQDKPHIKVRRQDGTMTNSQWRAEFGTVKIHGPRQSGHTTAAVQLLFANDDALLFIHSNSERAYNKEIVNKHTKLLRSREDLMNRVVRFRDDNVMFRIRPTTNRTMIILDRAEAFTLEQKLEIYGAYADTKLIVEIQ